MATGVKKNLKSVSGSVLGFGLGAGWEIDKTEQKAARQLVAFLEDRRVLFRPVDLEDQRHADISVDEIRSQCTSIIAANDDSAPIVAAARAIRQACRKFLDQRTGLVRGCNREGDFLIALGELRANVGLHILAVADAYGLTVEPELAAVLPRQEAGDK